MLGGRKGEKNQVSLDSEQWNFSGGEDIESVTGSHYIVAGLKKDGTVVATGGDPDGYYDKEISDSIQQVETWTDIVKVIANYGSGEYFTGLILGLKSDGTVVAAQENTWVETVNQWTVR